MWEALVVGLLLGASGFGVVGGLTGMCEEIFSIAATARIGLALQVC